MDDRRPDFKMLKRLAVLAIVFSVVGFAVIVGRLFFMQVIRYDFYADKATALQTRDKTIYPARGTIYDTNMKPLAISASTEMLILMGNKLETDDQRAEIAENISRILEADYADIFAKTQNKSSYIVISRGIEKAKADEIRAFILEKKYDKCMYMLADSTRYYPYGNFLAHVLGFVGMDEQGLAGLEYYYEEELSGTVGRAVTATNGKGEEMPFEYEIYYDAQDGNSLVLTIDEVLQHYLEKNLEIAYNDNQVRQSAIGIVMDVNTGGVLAMASYPDFDPNTPFTIVDEKTRAAVDMISDANERAAARSTALYKQWNNRAVSFTYYPGSTFKIITASTALEEGVVTLKSTFNCAGRIKVGVETINCWRSYNPHGMQTLAEAMKNSCNPAFIQIGLKVGAKTFAEYVEAFGLRTKTGIDLPGEAVGLFNLKQEIDLAVYSFGQNFTLTPIQLITAVSSVANGGTLLKPHLVREIVDSEGSVIKRFERSEVRQVISGDVSETMCSLLEGVVKTGTGQNAYTMGYRVAGKTGTTEKIADQIASGEELRISSFVAFAPADDPQIAVLILLDEPTVQPVSGGLSVAPVVRRFMEEAMPYLGVEPQYTEKELKNKDVKIPDIVGMTLADANAALKAAGVNGASQGTGDIVCDQLPAAGSIVSNSATVLIYMEGAAPKTEIKMPDLKGMSLTKARTTLKNVGLFLRVFGGASGGEKVVVSKQDAEKGSSVTYGQVITIELSDLAQTAE